MRPTPLPAYRNHPFAVIVKGRASTHGRRGDRFELTWFRYLYEDGDVRNVLRQQHWDVTGRRHESELPLDWNSTATQTFDRYVQVYREIAEQADGVPAPGQLSLELA